MLTQIQIENRLTCTLPIFHCSLFLSISLSQSLTIALSPLTPGFSLRVLPWVFHKLFQQLTINGGHTDHVIHTNTFNVSSQASDVDLRLLRCLPLGHGLHVCQLGVMCVSDVDEEGGGQLLTHSRHACHPVPGSPWPKQCSWSVSMAPGIQGA